MACSKTPPPRTKRVRTSTTARQFEVFGDWMAAVGLDNVKMVIKRKSVQLTGGAPTMTFEPTIQTAQNRPDDPGAWAVISGASSYTGAGENNTGVLTVAAATAGKAWVRFGAAYTLGGTTPTDGQADIEVHVSVLSCGNSVGTRSQELQAFNTTTDSFAVVTGWVPAVDVDKVVAFFVITNLLGNFRCQLAYRTAATSIEAPGAWNLAEQAYRNANGETTTGEIALSLGSEMFVQFGVAYSQSSAGAAPGQASVTTSVSVRRT